MIPNQCSHVWIDLTEPPIQRAPYSPIVGEGRREMKPGKTYTCRGCGDEMTVPEKKAEMRQT